jgi:riboflavin synthase
MHVALVDSLKARAACHGAESQKNDAAETHGVECRARQVRTQLASRALDGRATHRYIGAMFTGLVEATGVLTVRSTRGPGARLSLRAHLGGGPLVLGESIAVDGCCLSVAALLADGFEVDASAETLARTTLGRVPLGQVVNLERALRAGDRLGGHLAAGHVDGVGELVDRRRLGEAVAMTFSAPADIARFVAEKGSIAVSGVSLTVNAVTSANRFDVAIVPITLQKTSLASLVPGDAVNLEVDLIARYVARLMEAGVARAVVRTP